MDGSRVRIDATLKAASGGRLALGVIRATVEVGEHDDALWREIERVVSGLVHVTVEGIPALKEVAALRAVYKALGKDPSRYRGSSEALLRRVAQGKGLYRVNTVVDINNLISLESRRSVASYDRTKLEGEIVFRAGLPGESYEAIGKGVLNVEGLPVFADKRGPFGSSTSDSTRAMITPETTDLLMAIIGFDGADRLDDQLTRAADLLSKYAHARNVSGATLR